MAARRRSLTRRTAFRDPLPTILIVCEGRTEEKILGDLRSHLRLPNASVVVVGQAGVPKTVVEEAKKSSSEFDETWVVFDRDEHPRWREAIEEAFHAKLKFAVSNPCIELWGLLLHRSQEAHIERSKAQSELSKIHPKYHHEKNPYFSLSTVLCSATDAHRRAELLLKTRQEDAVPFENPSTRFHLLVQRLLELE